MKVKKERMWGTYHKVRTSSEFTDRWKRFLQDSIKEDAAPSFFQFVTDKVFKDLVKSEYPVNPATPSSNSPMSALTFEEKNALRYVAGYVCRKVREQLESSSLSNKDELILSLIEVTAGDAIDGGDETEAWTNIIDRGGLWHVSDMMYSFFFVLEEIVRQHLSMETLDKQDPGARQKLIDTVLHTEDIQFQWSIITADVDSDIHVAQELSTRLINLYLTVRGFAYASSCLEFYKHEHKKTLQKKKALRKKLSESEQ